MFETHCSCLFKIVFYISFIAVKVEGQPCDMENNESIASNIDFVYSLQDNYGKLSFMFLRTHVILYNYFSNSY